MLCEAVDQRRVPAVEVPPEVLEHHQRRRTRLRIAEAAVGERHVSDLDREVLGRQLTGLRGGDRAFLGQGVRVFMASFPLAGEVERDWRVRRLRASKQYVTVWGPPRPGAHLGADHSRR